ncbi:MAG: phospholipid carrier-dependent glycosyltransferase [Candidatus Eisenbacteria bacterium]
MAVFLRRHPLFIIGAAITLVALGIRAHRLDWGLPDIYEEGTSVEKAWGFWSWDEPGLDLDPHFFNYPSLHFYIQFGVQALLRAGGTITGAFPDEAAFRAAYLARPGVFYLAGRWSTALFGAATVLLVFLVGLRAGGLRTAAPAALFRAFHGLHVQKSRFVEVDVTMTFFVVLSTWLLVRYVSEGKRRDLLAAGLCAGLAASVKYPAALFLLQLPWAEKIRQGAPFRPGRVLAAVLLGGVAFAAASPYVILDFGGFLRDFGAESLHMREGHFGGAGEGVLGAARLFAGGFGWPLFLAALAGVLAAAVRPRGVEKLLWPMPVLLFVLLAASRMQAPHYPLPAVPSLALLAAVLLARVIGGGSRARAGLLAGATTVLLVPPALADFAAVRRAAEGDTRARARVWIEERVPSGSLVLLEPHGPQLLASSDFDRYRESMEFAAIREALLGAIGDRPWYRSAVLPSFSIDVDRSERFYRLPPYQWFEYLVLSDDIGERYRSDPDRFPAQNEFYRAARERYEPLVRFETGRGSGPGLEIMRHRRGLPPLPVALDPEGAMDGDFVRFIRSIAGLYRDRGLPDAAPRIYLALLALGGEDGETLFQLGMDRALAGDPSAAIELLQRSLRADPGLRQARMNLGILYCQTGRAGDGIEIFQEMLAEREDADLHGNLGSALLQSGRTEEAIPHFRRFLVLAPNHPRAGDIVRLLDSIPGERSVEP